MMEIKTRVPGVVQKIMVKEGDEVKVKDSLAVLEAMKMEQAILCPVDGTVSEINIEVGDHVRAGAVLMVVE